MPTLNEICEFVKGELRGPPDLEIAGVGSVEQARPDQIAPVDSRPFLDASKGSKAGALLVSPELADEIDVPAIVHRFPLPATNQVMEMLRLVDTTRPTGVHPTAVVDGEVGPDAYAAPYSVVSRGARIGARCHLDAHAFVEHDVVIGDDCWIGPGAVIHAGARLGDRVRISAHAVISRPGFGYAPGPNGPVFLHHIGTTVLEDDVHIGAGVTIDRARFDETRIGAMTAMDCLNHIGHNAHVGARTFMAAQSGLAGNAFVGNDCKIGGQVGIANNCGVGDRSVVGAKSGIMRDEGSQADVFWYPAMPRKKAFKLIAWLRKQAGA
jgi:UDP-3-O-[3-hydroxymyristoyl] glucosamine N-acyltransferase